MPFFPQFSNLFVPPYVPPASLTDLLLHLDAELGVTITDGEVSAWEDQSTAGNNFSGEGATQEGNYINGYSAIYFNGSSSYLESPSTLLNDCNELSIIAVWKVTYSGNKGVFGTAGYSDIEITADPNMRVRNNNYSGSLFNGVAWFDDGAWSISSFVGENEDGQIFKNGVEITDDVNPATIQLPTRNGIAYRLGQYAWSGYSLFAEFYLAEFYIYRKRLTGTERSDLENALNAKYEIY